MSRSDLYGRLVSLAERAPEGPLYRFLGQRRALTAAGLAHRAATLSGALDAAGEAVLVCTGPEEAQAVGLFGTWAAGAVAVPVYPPPPGDEGAALDTIARVARASGARRLVAPQAIGASLVAGLGARLGALAPTLVPVEAEGPPRVAAPAEDALLLYTSGSTGDPKGVVVRHAALIGNIGDLVASASPGDTARIGTWLPHAHIAGLYTRLMGVVAPAEVVVMPPAAFSRQPLSWLRMLSEHRCTFSAAPDFAYALCAAVATDADVAGLDLSAWRMAVSGGEKIRPATVDRFFARFAPAGVRLEILRPYYGMTETLCTSIPQGRGPARLVVSRDALRFRRVRPPKDATDAVTFLSNGRPLGDTRVIAVQPEGRFLCQAGHVGELWTAGPATTPGYHREPALSARVARATLADGAGPWLRTGDLGLVHDGEVYVTGRLKEVLIVRGKNHHPPDIEATVAAAWDLGGGQCAAFTVLHDGDEALGLAVEVEDAASVAAALIRAVRRAVARAHGLAVARLYLVPPGALPRTPTQKVARAACRARSDSGAWDRYAAVTARRKAAPPPEAALAELSGPALVAALIEHLIAALPDAPADTLLDTPLADLGLGSLELADLAARLRRLTGVEPPFDALFDGTTVRGLAARVAEGRGPGRDALARWREPVHAVATNLPNRLPPQRSRAGAVLLTGATGYLGSYLLAALLRQSDRAVRCLVRASDPAAGRARLVAALRAGPGWDPAWAPRVTPLCGDVTAPKLGLDDAAWGALVRDAALIVHNAANVNFVAPYATLRRVNVDPVHELVRLATHGACRAVHLVSTLAVFNATYRREQRLVRGIDRLQKPDHLYSGYAQSKWVCEAAFRVAGSRGLKLGVHRPGLITGAWASGHTNPDDFLCRFIKGCVELGVYPDADVELDLVAVDDVADGIAAAVLGPLEAVDTFHWSNPRPVTISALMSVFAERGHRLQPEPLQRWLHRVRTALPMSNALFPVHPFLLEVPPGSSETILEFMDGLPLEVDTTEADAARARAGLPPRPVDRAAMARMAARLEADGFLPRGER